MSDECSRNNRGMQRSLSATVNDVMNEASGLLGANLTNLTILSGNPLRARAAALKTALDQANNNLPFVQPFP